MIDQVTNAGASGALERLMQFAGQRHRLIVNNIANMDTPGFTPRDVPIERFQRMLGEAVDARRAANGGVGPVILESSPEIEVDADGIRGLTLRPEALRENILFHDENDRDHERLMQDLVENFTMFRAAAQLLRKEFDVINTAIRERVL